LLLVVVVDRLAGGCYRRGKAAGLQVLDIYRRVSAVRSVLAGDVAAEQSVMSSLASKFASVTLRESFMFRQQHMHL
jgi:hypothetical protein